MQAIETVKTSGSVRVDLLGGTLDLSPINLILPHAPTINLATSLKAEVILSRGEENKYKIISKDYNSETVIDAKDFSFENIYITNKFNELSFIVQILDELDIEPGIEIELSSGSPPGAGLGGSSSMGVTLYKALCKWKRKSFDPEDAVKIIRDIEGRILNAGVAGYQDYYPALYGGVLGLFPTPGKVNVYQFFNEKLKKQIEARITLVYSGQTRLSGINNWEVYKSFFDKNEKVISGLENIAALSTQAFYSLKKNEIGDEFFDLIKAEGDLRNQLFSNIATKEMLALVDEIKNKVNNLGFKICGAGGGGCFLLIHQPEEKNLVCEFVKETSQMKVLEFEVSGPVKDINE